MRRVRTWSGRLVSKACSQQGQALVEYGLMLALVSVGTIGVLAALGADLQNVYDHVNDALEKVLGAHGHCGHKACK
jgi:Flp pilus assembly pilin Flp